MSMEKDVSRLIRTALDQGWTLKRQSGHFIMYSPDGKGIVVIGKTPSDHRAYRNTLRYLRRYGYRE